MNNFLQTKFLSRNKIIDYLDTLINKTKQKKQLRKQKYKKKRTKQCGSLQWAIP